MNELKAELQRLYSDASKHAVYQNIPDFVSAELGYTEAIDETWRGDRPRLAYLTDSRTPTEGERWVDFGANTGFFTLSLAKKFPLASFTAIEANPNHARFITRVAQYFAMDNVEVIQRAVGLAELDHLPTSDFLLHLNVLHHAGHDFDASLVPDKSDFASYARQYLSHLRKRATAMLFQMGSNWGGDKNQPLVGVHADLEKLRMFSGWLHDAGWCLSMVAYPNRLANSAVRYENLSMDICRELNDGVASEHPAHAFQGFNLDDFPGEFYRRPLFRCDRD